MTLSSENLSRICVILIKSCCCRVQFYRQRAESPVSSCLSMRSDRSKDPPLVFSNGPSDTQKETDITLN